MKDIFDEYVINLALFNLYMFENKKSISLDKLNEFRNEMLNEIERVQSNEEMINYFRDLKEWLKEAKTRPIDKRYLNDFLIDYCDYFYMEDDNIMIRDDISCDRLGKIVSDLQQEDGMNDLAVFFCGTIEDNKALRKILNISTIEKIIVKYKDIEQRLEDSYNKLYTEEDNPKLRSKIKALLLLRCSFLLQVKSLEEYQADAFKLIAAVYNSENNKMVYDKCPVDLILWKEFNSEQNDFSGDIDVRLYDINQYAIFGKENNHLYLSKIQVTLEDYYNSEYNFGIDKDITDSMEDDCLDFSEYDDDAYIEDFEIRDSVEDFWVFYLHYLNNLNRFMKIYGENNDLIQTKRRLTYVLDKPELRLYEDDSILLNTLEENEDIEFDEDSLYFWISEMNFMADEVFLVPCNEYTIRKLLLVSTYYYLTESDEILNIVNKHRDDPRYSLFYEIMINNFESNNAKYKEQVQKLIRKKEN